jgi:hypothetical protein
MYSIFNEQMNGSECRVETELQMKSKANAGESNSRAQGRGRSFAGSMNRSKIYTRPELYEAERPAYTWALRLGIVLTMLGVAAVFRQPLHAALSSVFGA